MCCLRTLVGRCCLALALLLGGGLGMQAHAEDAVEFNPEFLIGGSGRTLDLRRYSMGNLLAPGIYRIDVVLNGTELGSVDMRLRLDTPGRQNVVCVDDVLIRRFGLEPSALPEAVRHALAAGAGKELADASKCRAIGEVAEGATARFDPAEQRVEFSIPQVYLARSARGYLPPDRWQSGIDAGLLSYRYSDFRVSSPSAATDLRFLGLNGGINLGDWRLRHNGSYSSDATGRHYQAIATNAQRDMPEWLATLTVGDGNTDGQLFDSTGFRGIQVATDDRMLPDSMRGYAPVIRGEARTNARVKIRQGGVLLYETVVPPGPFAISDLYAMGAGSDLEVTITEADGTERVMSVPFSPLPQLLREGARRWGVTLGTVRGAGLSQGTPLLQGTLQRGLGNSLAAEAGLQLTPRYGAMLAGAAFNTPLGAFALDGTVSRFAFPQEGTRHGASLRASYSKFVDATLTNLTFAAYRNSTANYFSLRDAMLAQDIATRPDNLMVLAASRTREREVLSVDQAVNDRTSLAATWVSQSYWERAGRDRTFQASLGWRIAGVSLTFALARNLPAPGTVTSTRASVMLNLPLGSSSDSTWSANSQVAHDSRIGTSSQAGVSGTLGEDRQYGFNFSETRNPGGDMASVGGSWRGNALMLSASASHAPGFTQTSINAEGGVVVHPGGVTFSNSLGDTVGLVHAPAAPGASVIGVPGSQVDEKGYAVVPYLTPYNLNQVELGMDNAPADTQLDTSVQQAVPRAGAVVLVDFNGRRGRNILIDARADDGSRLPFSATVTDGWGRVVGLVGQGSRIEANVVEDSGRLIVRWGDAAADQCALDYSLPPAPGGKATAAFTRIDGVCKRAQHEAHARTP